MTCPVHTLCEDCYRSMVDAGKARPDPDERVPAPTHRNDCCSCGAPGTLLLFIETGEHYLEREYGHPNRPDLDSQAALTNRPVPAVPR